MINQAPQIPYCGVRSEVMRHTFILFTVFFIVNISMAQSTVAPASQSTPSPAQPQAAPYVSQVCIADEPLSTGGYELELGDMSVSELEIILKENSQPPANFHSMDFSSFYGCTAETEEDDPVLEKLFAEKYGNLIGYVMPEIAKNCGMTQAQAYAISYYTGSGYGMMNHVLRNRKSNPSACQDMSVIIDSMQAGLAKIKPYFGYVRRNTSIPANILKNYQPGYVVTEDAFSSTSLYSVFSGNVRLVILSKNCKYVAPLSNFSTEYEAVCPAESKFFVHHRIDSGAGQILILMEQIK